MRTGLRARLGARLALRLGTHMPRLAIGRATIGRGVSVFVGDAVASTTGTSTPTTTAATTTAATTTATATNALAILFPRRARRAIAVIGMIARNALV